MSGAKLIGVILLALGILALAYGGFTYTRDKDEAHIGPINIAVEKKEHVNIPIWAGVAAAVVGGVLLAKKS